MGNSCHLFLAHNCSSSFPLRLWDIQCVVFWFLTTWIFRYIADKSIIAYVSSPWKKKTYKNATYFCFIISLFVCWCGFVLDFFLGGGGLKLRDEWKLCCRTASKENWVYNYISFHNSCFKQEMLVFLIKNQNIYRWICSIMSHEFFIYVRHISSPSLGTVLFSARQFFITYRGPGIPWWRILPPKTGMRIHNERCIQDNSGAHLHKWLWIHKLQIYEIHFLVKILGLSPSNREKKSFWHGHLKIDIRNSFALLQIETEDFRKLLGNLNQKKKKLKHCFLEPVSDKTHLTKYFSWG